jgi:hypothetical protein
VNPQKILDAYQKDRGSRPGAKGRAPELTEQDMEAARVAASFPEHVLRQATVMRAAFERSFAKNPPQDVCLDLPGGAA